MTAASVAEVRALLAGLAALPYYDNGVDSLEHALQAAGLASAAGSGDELVLAAALHDIGRAPEIVARFGRGPHEAIGAAFVRTIASERVAWLVGAHVAAKRALVAEDPGYARGLSAVSQASLRVQGGAFDAAAAREFRRHPWAADAIQLRRWDDGAKVPGAAAPSIDDVVACYARCEARR